MSDMTEGAGEQLPAQFAVGGIQPTYEQIRQLEEAMLAAGETVEPPVEHHWADGVYGREMFIPAGTLLYGWLATRADLETVLIISAIVYATAALATLLVPSVRRLRRFVDSATEPDHDLSADATDS